MKLCPFCAEEIKDAAILCKHCGSQLTINEPEPEPEPEPQKQAFIWKKNYWKQKWEIIKKDNNMAFTATAPPQRGLTVGDGVRTGCGLFVMLPIIIIAVIILIALLGKGCS